MKFLITFILVLVLIIFSPHDPEYDVKANYSLIKEPDKIMAVTADYKPYKSGILAEIPDDYEWSVIAKQKYANVIAQIYKGESNFGAMDICRSQGLANGFGFMEPNPLKHGPTCFDSFEKVVSHVNNWIHARVQEGFNLAELNCYYIRGIRSSQCNTSYKLN